MTDDALQSLTAFPALELLTAVAPFEKRKAVRGAPAALFSREIPVYGVRPWIPLLRLFAERQSVQFGAFGLSHPQVYSTPDDALLCADLSFAGGISQARFACPHSDYTRGLLSGEWATLLPGTEILIPMVKTNQPNEKRVLLPTFDNTDAGEIVLSWTQPQRYRLTGGRFLRRLTEAQLHSIVIDDSGGRPVFSGLPSWLVEPRLVWSDLPAELACGGPRSRSREQAAFDRYIMRCERNRITPTARGAEAAMREELCGSGLISAIMWMAIQSMVWLIISRYFNNETSGTE